MSSREIIAIFGSRVLKDGSPSGSLLRRTLSGIKASKSMEAPRFFVTGGSSDISIPTEACVMKKILSENGISESDVISDHQSSDTLESVLALHAQLNTTDRIHICSDNYHVLRIVFLLRMLGRKTSPLWIESGHFKTGMLYWAYMWCREVIAFVYDGILLAWRILTKGISS